jgi:hypothetical protein
MPKESVVRRRVVCDALELVSELIFLDDDDEADGDEDEMALDFGFCAGKAVWTKVNGRRALLDEVDDEDEAA